jgi:anti-sigma factor RsiW
VSGTDEIGRITVSRDALRADLAEMELRLRLYFDDALKKKASAAEVAIIRADVKVLNDALAARDRGEFTKAQMLALDEHLEAAGERAWTWRQQAATVVSAGSAAIALLITIVLALHGVPL